MLEFIVESAAGVFQRTVVPKAAHVEVLMNAVSFAELTFDDDDEALGVFTEGARVRVLFDEVQRLAGPWIRLFGKGPTGDTTVLVVDDFFLFKNPAWPKPGSAVTAQTDTFKRYSDDLETVVKAVCTDVSARLGFGWTMATNKFLGDNVRVEARFTPLTDLLVPALDAQKLRWTITDGVVDVTEGELFPRVLTLDSGVVGDYSWSVDAPTVTRVVVGGEGAEETRVFRGYVDSDRETDWGFVLEAFKDSRLAEGITDLQPDADEVFAEGAPRVSFSADLNETSWFRYGTYDVGDRVHIQVPHVDVTDVISKVVIDDTPGEGLVVVPTVGAVDESADARLFRKVAALGRGVRDLGKR